MPSSFASLHVHVVFSTRQRRPLIDTELQPRLFEYLGGACRGEGSPLVAAGGVADHVHLLISLSREQAVSELVRQIKANSSKWMHAEIGRPQFAWQEGYGAFAVSYSQVEEVRKYLDRQAEHHRRQTFREEFIAILKLHELEFKLEYLD